MARFEVETRAKERAVVPRTLCCACGRGPGEGVTLGGKRLEAAGPEGVSGAPTYHFPLCDGCADAESARDRFPMAGALLGGGAVVAYYAALLFWGGPVDASIQTLVYVLLFAWVGMLLGGGAGWVLARLVGTVSPRVAWGDRVGGAADYTYVGSRGRTEEGHHCVFRFSSGEYARAFTEANAPILLPAGGGARDRAGALGRGSAPGA